MGHRDFSPDLRKRDLPIDTLRHFSGWRGSAPGTCRRRMWNARRSDAAGRAALADATSAVTGIEGVALPVLVGSCGSNSGSSFLVVLRLVVVSDRDRRRCLLSVRRGCCRALSVRSLDATPATMLLPNVTSSWRSASRGQLCRCRRRRGRQPAPRRQRLLQVHVHRLPNAPAAVGASVQGLHGTTNTARETGDRRLARRPSPGGPLPSLPSRAPGRNFSEGRRCTPRSRLTPPTDQPCRRGRAGCDRARHL